MKRRMKNFFAALLAVILVLQVAVPTNAQAKAISGGATVYIKSESGEYLYADGADVKIGEFQEKNLKYAWALTQKDDGSYWIMNMGTNTYMCLENANGTVKLESTIYEVWASSKWTIRGNSTSSTIDNVWKSVSGGNAGGYIYTTGGNAVYYGATAQKWIFEGYSVNSDVQDDGKYGWLHDRSAADDIAIPEPSTDMSKVGATMPYIRYDSESAELGGGAAMVTSKDWSLTNVASQASNQSYVNLPNKGAYAEWTVMAPGNGVNMRFTLPDSSDGMGLNGSVDVYVNGQMVRTIDLTSYYMWQYLNGGASDTPGIGAACFAFDEVHFRLDQPLQAGDKIRIQSSGKNSLEYGVDFLEIEETGDAIPQPAGSYSVVDFGAVPDDGGDDYAAITACIAAANAAGKDVYFPAGTYHINQIWRVGAQNMRITGAGIWYTNIQFTNSAQQTGGISGNGDGSSYNLEFCNMYINSSLRSRYGENAIYKCFMDVYDGKSLIHDIWEEHFECGFWIADYNGSLDYSDEIKIVNCRIRNNLADGVNFCQGTSNATVYNCSIRNNGDDGLAMWNNDYMSAKDEYNNVFCYNTIDFIWRAGGIAIYGGEGHKIYNNYIRDCYMSSGIHLNTTFPGYKFNNTRNISFANNVIVRSGCSTDTWRSEYGAVDMTGAVKNVTFDNTYIYNAQHDGVRIGDMVSGVTFNDLYIYGTGKDGQTPSYSSLPHAGAAIMCFGGNPSITVNGLTLSNIAYADTYYNVDSSKAAISNVSRVSSYSVPGYPAVGSINTDHRDKPFNPQPIPTTEETETETEFNPIDPIDPIDPINPTNPSVEITDDTNPDMIITDISWTPANPSAGDAVVFTAVVKNQGKGVAEAGMINGVQFQIDGTCVAWSDNNSTQIQPGESVTVTACGGPEGAAQWTAEEGTHTVLAWVNDILRYPESNTTNNKKTTYITVAAAGTVDPVDPTDPSESEVIVVPSGNPDMVVTDISWTPANPVPGDKVVFSAVVKNIGTGVAPAGSVNGVQFQIDGTCVTWSDDNKEQLMPGQSVTVTATSGPDAVNTWTASLGNHSVLAWVNDIERFPESNLDNNKYTENITVEEKPVVVVPVEPASVALNKTAVSLKAGEKVTLIATVSPAGAADKTVTWKSSNTSVATVADGVVTAKAAGTATITVTTVNGKTATAAITVTAVAPAVSFKDVSRSDWYYFVVKEAVEKGIMSGYSDGTFRPNETMNRAMVVTVLHRMAGYPKASYKNTFSDVASGTYYTTPVMWASQNRVVNGYADGTFRPMANVTREQLAIMLMNFAKAQGMDVSARVDLSTYNDVAQISSYAKTGLSWAVATGIMSGTKTGDLMPGREATRAEGTKMFLNFFNLMEAQK